MSTDDEITVVALLDAFRHDYLSTEAAPFLSSLASDGVAGSNEEPFGYQTRPAFFAGLYPETSGICTMFERAYGDCPFSFARYLPKFVDNRKIIDWGLRRLLERYVRWKTEYSGVKNYGTPADIPLSMLHEFDFAEKELPWHPDYVSQSTLFDLLRAHDKNWSYQGWPLVTDYASDDDIVQSCVETVDEDHSFLYIHLSELDGLGHLHGPTSDAVTDGVKRIDSRLQTVWEHCERTFETVNLIAFGDHGMVEVAEILNLWPKLQSIDLSIGDDFEVFLDSTMARFWFETQQAETEIRSILNGVDSGTILTDQHRQQYRARFADNRYGDLLFLTEPGTTISPNFFNRSGDLVAGMHGYEPGCKDDQGMLLIHSTGETVLKAFETRPMVDIFSTAATFLNLPIPASSEGKSLVETARVMSR
jgi:predicted AlkP superfamily pyrophosphatase or phosphodiesterase